MRNLKAYMAAHVWVRDQESSHFGQRMCLFLEFCGNRYVLVFRIAFVFLNHDEVG